MHTEIISYSATQPNTGGAASAFTGDSLIIKNSKGPARILAVWAFNQIEGFHQITFPSGHDTTRGWRTAVEALEPDMRLPLGLGMDVQPQETLSITIAGSNTAGDVETGHILVHYDNLPGVTQRAIEWNEVVRRAVKHTTVQVTLAGSAAGYGTAELINAETDLLLANRDYAVVGIETATPCGAICISGPDTGNVKVGVPGAASHSEMTSGFFGLLSRAYGLPLIPVINSGNKNSTSLVATMNENTTSVVASVNLVLLSEK